MAVIFSFSAENAEESLETSDSIVNVVIDSLLEEHKDSLSESEYNSFREKLSHFVRKSAHFAAYTVLGILTGSALYTHRLKNKTVAYLSVLICFLYAVSDEIHQVFVPGRAGRISDVMIDTSGAVIGVLLCLFTAYFIHRFKKSKNLTSQENTI